jgi:hypothetical protein
MTKRTKSLHDVIKAKARTDGRYAIAYGLCLQCGQLGELTDAFKALADSIGHMRPMVTVETATVPFGVSGPVSMPESEAK